MFERVWSGGGRAGERRFLAYRQDRPPLERAAPLEGKRASRRNALRHGLTAETVIEGLEDTGVYWAFEATIISDYDAQTAVERELVLRLASLLWRMRRAISIETDLLGIQSGILRDRQNRFGHLSRPPGHEVDPGTGGQWRNGFDAHEQADARHDRWERLDDRQELAAETRREVTYCFLRLGNLDNGAFERLGRYNARLWAQTLFLLQSTRRR
jgi:hypothetical protein